MKLIAPHKIAEREREREREREKFYCLLFNLTPQEIVILCCAFPNLRPACVVAHISENLTASPLVFDNIDRNREDWLDCKYAQAF